MNTAPPRPPEQAAARKKARRRISQARRDRRAAFIVGILTAAVVVAIVWLAVSASEKRVRYTPPPETTVPDSVRHMGYDVTFYPDLPVNELDPEAFVTDPKTGYILYDDGVTMSETGIDVSQHQGEIDWKKVAACGVRFAFLRIGYRGSTEGLLYPDERFEEYYAGARAADIQVGVYFYSQAVTVYEASREADYVLELLKDRKLDLPVVMDWEFADIGDGRTDTIDSELLTGICQAFCQRIRRDGYQTAVYFNKNIGYEHYDLDELSDYAFWIADYNETPHFYYAHEYWQYTDAGGVDGIAEPVDMDLRFVRKKP